MAENVIKGLPELIKELQELPKRMEQNVLRTAIFRAAQFLRDRIKEAAPVYDGYPPRGGRFAGMKPGGLKASIVAVRRRGAKGEVAAGVGGPWYTRLVEYGHALKTHGSKKRVVGHVPANPFVRSTAERFKGQIMDIVAQGLQGALGKQQAKYGVMLERAANEATAIGMATFLGNEFSELP